MVAGGGRGCPWLPFIPMAAQGEAWHVTQTTAVDAPFSACCLACWLALAGVCRLGNDAAGCSDESPWFSGHAQHQCRTSIQLHTVWARAIKPSGIWGRSHSQPSRPTGTVGCFLFSALVHTYDRTVETTRVIFLKAYECETLELHSTVHCEVEGSSSSGRA